MKNLVLAITTFNRINYLKECIESWNNTRNKNYSWSLIIADDGSNKDCIDYIDSIDFDGVYKYLIKNNRHGMSHQTNSIFKKLNEIDFNLCFKVDNDFLFIKPGWEELYINAIEDTGFEHLVYENPKFNIGSWCEEGLLAEPVFYRNLVARVKMMYVKGCFYTITPNILKKIGYMDIENFFHGMEHIDFSARCARAGFNNPRHPFDHKDSNLYLGYRFPWNKDQLTINLDIYKLNGNNPIDLIKKKCIINDTNRIFIDYKEVSRRMRDSFKIM